jgi:hypothetical protein
VTHRGLPTEREVDTLLDEEMRELVGMHNDHYHPGTDCPGEDEDGACHLRTGKPAVVMWTGSGPVYTAYGQQWLGSRS